MGLAKCLSRQSLWCLSRASTVDREFRCLLVAHAGNRNHARHHSTSSSTDVIEEQQRSDEPLKSSYDAIIIGAGHNGLVASAYLQKSGLNVCVLERRHTIGGAAVTEELIPGFKFSRASYLLSLLRPQVYQDLELKKHGLKIYLRDPNSYTPLLHPAAGGPRSLLLGKDTQQNLRQIAQFSQKDAKMYVAYEEELARMVDALDPLLDQPPVHIPSWANGSWWDRRKNLSSIKTLMQSMRGLGKDAEAFYSYMTAPASVILDKWFESEPLKATLATDSVIGAMLSSQSPGSGYVLLHHVMGELEGNKGAWAYVEGGMGAVSVAMARSARAAGATIFTNKPVAQILVTEEQQAEGVLLEDGTTINSRMVLSNATPQVTFVDMLAKDTQLPEDFVKHIAAFDYTSPVTKINIAVNQLPNFLADPNDDDGKPLPHHCTTIHLNCDNSQVIHEAFLDAQRGCYSQRPIIEMTIPSSVDPTVAPPGCHVVQLFTQYTPYTLAGGQEWTEDKKNEYADLVFDNIEEYAPGFKQSVIGRDILTPPDIERIFGITGGNIFHGSVSLNQLYFMRPTAEFSNYRSPIKGLYLCGSGAHPGGGVMGAPGRLAALEAIKDYKS